MVFGLHIRRNFVRETPLSWTKHVGSGEAYSKCVLLKAYFYKNNAKPPIVTPKLPDSAPYFGACLPEIWGQDCANFV